MKEIIYLAGGCLWGVQAYVKTLPGVLDTEAGRANGTSNQLESDYDGYAECVKTTFDTTQTSAKQLTAQLFKAIDPYSINAQGEDTGPKYRTGIYSENPEHLAQAKAYINQRGDTARIVVEVLPLTNYIPSADVHQDYLDRHPEAYCHIPKALFQQHED